MSSSRYSLSYVLDLLLEGGLLSAAQRRDIEVRAPQQEARLRKLYSAELPKDTTDASSLRYHVSPGELVASFEMIAPNDTLIDEERIAAIVAADSGLPFHKIDPLALDMGAITRTLSRPFALRHVLLPVKVEEGKILVAVEDPFDQEAIEGLRRLSRGEVERVVSPKRDILKAITEIYGFRRSVESAARDAEQNASFEGDFEQLLQLKTIGELEEGDQPIVNAVDFLFRYAFDQRASDIHIEPRREDTQVRLRIDGVLHDVHTIPRRVHSAIVSRIKAVSRLDIAEKRRPQDGRIKTVFGEREVELRVSTLPVAFGEKVVIRIFDPDILLLDLVDLGFDINDQAVFESWIKQPNGMILITGPTGSGKTTTLYTTLQSLATEEVNVTTVEDPIEMVTDSFNQVMVQSKAGLSFAAALRTVLRQDPDIIMLGEIRDPETAEMAVQAALTGHLVFATLHTNDSVGAIARLRDLKVPSFLIASVLAGVMAQRLVRKVCPHCSSERMPDAAEQALIGDPSIETIVVGEGCRKCRGTGYLGRIGVFEMFDVDDGARRIIAKETGEAALRAHANSRGMRGLRECSMARLADKSTTLAEVMRVSGESEHNWALDDEANEEVVQHGTEGNE